MKEKLFAFWNYDTFPFLLGGEVISMDDSGCVQIKEYGYYFFRPQFFTNETVGREIKQKLTDFEHKHYQAMREMNERHMAEVEAYLRGKVVCNLEGTKYKKRDNEGK